MAKALGKGINAHFTIDVKEGESVQEICIKELRQIHINRGKFDDDKLEELNPLSSMEFYNP